MDGVHVLRVLAVREWVRNQVSVTYTFLVVCSEPALEVAVQLNQLHVVLLEVHGN